MEAFDRVEQTIGDTPLVYLQRMAEGLPGRVAIKLESRNPGGSVKDRIASNMILQAENDGLIAPGKSVIIEPTSGNTGIGLAMIGASRGYRIILTMPESMSVERRRLLVAYGAELVLTPAGEGMKGAISAASTLVDETPDSFMPDQFGNPANPAAHYEGTGPEIDTALPDVEIGAMVAGVGTVGTITGAGRYLSEKRGAQIVAVEPEDSPVISQTRDGLELKPGPHLIQGIGAGFIPTILDLDVIDEVILMSGQRSIEVARRLAAEEGLLCGISSGANVAAAIDIASRDAMKGKTVVTFAPSTGERYLSTALWDGIA